MEYMKEVKNCRLAIRITEKQLCSIRIAAALRNITIAQYVLESVGRRIESEHHKDSINWKLL